MAHLSSRTNIGNTSTSSLIRSSRSIQSAITANQDEFYRIQYENSAKTATDLQIYQKYLTSRQDQLLSTGTIADNTKAMAIGQTIVTATASNVSADITRENIAIMNGNATPTDKLNLISQEFTRAGAVGNQALQQSLVSQASSLSQTIQYQAQVSQDAANALTSKTAGLQNNVADVLLNNLKQLNADAGAAGMDKLNSVLKDYVSTNKEQLLKLANGPGISPDAKAAIIAAVNTSQPNYQDIVTGTTAAISSAHYLAGVKEFPVDPVKAQSYFQQQVDIANGSTKIPTLAGSLSQQQLIQWQQNPAEFIPRVNADNGTLEFSYQPGGHTAAMSAINGLKFNPDGTVQAAYTGQAAGTPLNTNQAANTEKQLTALGFSFDKKATSTSASNNNGIAIQATDKLAKFLQPLVGGQKNLELRAYVTPQGIQIGALDANGKSNIYLVAQDSSGKNALYQATGQYSNGNPIFGSQVASGDYGFNQASNSLWKSGVNTPSQAPSVNPAQAHTNGLIGLINNAQQITNSMQLKLQSSNPVPANPNNVLPPITPTIPSTTRVSPQVPAPNYVNPTISQPTVSKIPSITSTPPAGGTGFAQQALQGTSALNILTGGFK